MDERRCRADEVPVHLSFCILTDPGGSVPLFPPPVQGSYYCTSFREQADRITSRIRDMDVDTREELAEATALLETAKVLD